MAFYKLQQFFWFRKNKMPDMIYWYKEYVLKTPEQREMERRKARIVLSRLVAMNTILADKMEGERE